MSKKKVTAPLSYDPGKGRPKEFLAYLNWQEMQALQRLNGGNMERGPRGLPSFPPADSIGSNQTPGTGNWAGAPGGNSVGGTPGGDVGGTTESGNISGGATQTSSTASTAASSTTSAASQNTTDTAAQQSAAVNNAVSAARSSALTEDARRGGINSIDVGPMRTPVNIGGGQIAGTIASTARQTYSMPQQTVSASAAEEAIRRNFASSQLGSLYSDRNIKPELRNALAQSMWDTRISDATRSATGQKPRGQYGEISPTHSLAGFRTLDEQRSLSNYSQIKDPARGYHTWGMAADVGPTRLPGEDFGDYMDRIKEVNREISKNITDPNVAWAGDIFKKFEDPGHFQYGTGPVSRSISRYGSPISQAGEAAFTTPAGVNEASYSAQPSVPKPQARPLDLNTPRSSIAKGIIGVAQRLGIDPVDLGTAISYETAGTFDPAKKGQTTQWGTHKGLIQFGEPQAEQYGVDWDNPIESQLKPGGAVESYLKAAGVEPGMGLLDVYSAINAGEIGRYGASDEARGGAPGTVADKVRDQMGDHRINAESLLGNYIASAQSPATAPGVAVSDPAAMATLSGISQLPGVMSNFSIPSIPEASWAQKAALAAMPEGLRQQVVNKAVADAVQNSGFSLSDQFASGIGALRSAFASATPTTPSQPAEQQIADVENKYRGLPTPVQVAPGEGYFTKPDGTPFTAEDIQNLPPDVYQEYMDKVRWTHRTDEPYPLTDEQQRKVTVAGLVTKPITNNPLVSAITTGVKWLGEGIGFLPGAAGEAGEQIAAGAEQLKDPAAAVAEYERMNPLQKAQMLANAGKTYNYGTGTTVAGGIPGRDLGGKNYDQLYASYTPQYNDPYRDQAEPERVASMDDRLARKYRRWDKGIGIPSPGDPDYNEYRDYIRFQGSSAEV